MVPSQTPSLRQEASPLQRGRKTQAQEHVQRLSLTPLMRQSLQLLAMPSYELGTWLWQEALSNPAIELDDLTAADDISVADWSVDDADLRPTLGRLWDEGDFDQLANAVERYTLTDDLTEQLALLELPPTLRRVCDYLVFSLDERGYVRDGVLETLATVPGVEMLATEGLRVIQSLEPAGVGARSLEDCLCLQIERAGGPDAGRCAALVRDYLPQLASNNVGAIARGMGVSRAEADRLAAIVMRLNPVPARGYEVTCAPLPPARPEARVLPGEDGTLEVIPERAWHECVHVARDCLDAAQRAQGEDVRFIEASIRSARDLAHLVEARDTTVMSVIRDLVARQADALCEGPGSLVPLSMAEVAADLGVSESTVSRVVHGKWILAPCGMVELRSLFSARGFVSSETSTEISAAAVKGMISQIVSGEDAAHPLSDQRISDQLGKEGLSVSRRVVAKYRSAMGIAPASVRRRARTRT